MSQVRSLLPPPLAMSYTTQINGLRTARPFSFMAELDARAALEGALDNGDFEGLSEQGIYALVERICFACGCDDDQYVRVGEAFEKEFEEELFNKGKTA